MLAGRYRLEEVIGRGGMSTVYRATDQVLGRTVAVKVLLAELADEDPTYVERFQREARAAAALANASVVTVYDTGIDDAARFIVMEHVSGQSLATILSDRKPLPVADAVRVTRDVAGALSAAHAAGILHRDIKPANVMIADDGTVKVLDFGIARKLDSTTLTQAASVVGTAAYMSPERALGETGDARSDIYSLGCLLYAVFTGAPPFGGEVAAVILHKQINERPQAPSQVRPEIPAALDLLVLAMLAKRPEERPQSAADVRDDLAGLSGSLDRRAESVVSEDPAASTAKIDRTAATRVLAAPAGWDHRRRALVMAIATGALALAVIALASGGGGSSHPPGGTTRPPSSTLAPATTTHTPPPAATTATTPATPPVQQPPPPAAQPPPPGHGGAPPGKAKKHDHGKGAG